MAGVGYTGVRGDLVALGALTALSRNKERAADEIGLRRLIAAGYDPHEVTTEWRMLAAERAARDYSASLFFCKPFRHRRTLSNHADQAASKRQVLSASKSTLRRTTHAGSKLKSPNMSLMRPVSCLSTYAPPASQQQRSTIFFRSDLSSSRAGR